LLVSWKTFKSRLGTYISSHFREHPSLPPSFSPVVRVHRGGDVLWLTTLAPAALDCRRVHWCLQDVCGDPRDTLS